VNAQVAFLPTGSALQTACDLICNFGIPVFPCRPDKKPLTAHGFKDASHDLDGVELWWKENPNALVGVPTGLASKLLVIDIDVKNGAKGSDWYSENADRLHCGRVHKTHSGGWHLLYRMPEPGIRNSASKIAPGVDVRGEGGYLIWWPAHGFDAIGDLEDLALPPEWLLGLLTAVEKPTAKVKGNIGGPIIAGSRNESLTSLAGTMRRARASREEIEVALLAMNARCSPPLPESEVAGIARSVARYEPAADTQPEGRKLRLLTLDEFVQQPSRSYYVRGVIPCQSIVIVFGPPKGGKSFTVADLTMHAAHGLSWHGFNVARPVRVAYLVGEGTTGFKVRLRAWLEQHQNLDAIGEFRILPESLSLPDHVTEVIEALQTFKPDIIVTDTLNAYFGGGDEDKTADMTRFCGALRAVRDQVECSIVVIHHTGHGDQTRERGSIVLRASADVLIQVAKDAGGSGNVGFQVVNARDMEEMTEPLALRLRAVETSWIDEDGHPETSCVVEGSDAPVTLTGRSKPLGSAQSVVLELVRMLALQGSPNAQGEVLVARSDVAAIATKERGVSRQSVSSAWQALAGRKFLRLIEPGTVALKVKK